MYRWAQCVSTSHCTVWALFHHANTRGSGLTAQDCKPWCASKQFVIHVSCLALSDTWHWPQAQVLSQPLQSYLHLLLHFQTRWRTIHIYPAKIHGGVVEPRNSHLPQVMNWARQESWSWTSRSITRKNYGRWLSVSNHWRYELIRGNWCKTAVLHPITYTLRFDSAESIADSDLEDGQLWRMLTLLLGKLDAMEIQMGGASAQPTQADHSRRESLMSSSSREPRASGKLDAMFSFSSEATLDTFSVRNRSNEPGNQFENTVHSVLKICWSIKCWRISAWGQWRSFA